MPTRLKILPRDEFTIDSPLRMYEVVQRLRDCLASAEPSLRPSRQPFRGSIRSDTFVIHPSTGYGHSLRPHITGRVVSRPSGSTIEVTMGLNPFTRVLMAIWLTVATLIFVGFGIAFFVGTSTFAKQVGFIPFVFLPFGLLLCSVGYHLQADGAKRELYRLFDAIPR